MDFISIVLLFPLLLISKIPKLCLPSSFRTQVLGKYTLSNSCAGLYHHIPWKKIVKCKRNFSIIIRIVVLTLRTTKVVGFLVAAERYRLTSSFLIGCTPS